MSKTVIKGLAYCEVRTKSDNRCSIKLVGLNTAGKRVEVEVHPQPTYMLSHIAEEVAQALVKVRGKVQKDIDSVRQSLE